MLLKQFHEAADEEEKPYHPDSLLALSLASPEDARAISVRMTPWWTWAVLGIACLIISIFLMVIAIALSVGENNPDEGGPWFQPKTEAQ